MNIEFKPAVLEKLERLANQQQRSVEDIIESVVEVYVSKQSDVDVFDDMINTLMQEHAWLLDRI
jgi:uncharacterized membrane protein YheB (UPF0754 family)